MGEEENLTHYGQSISEIEQFDDDPRSDDEDEEKNKKLDAEMNFGGFMTKSDVEFSTGKGNSRQDYIEEMIAESKKRKFEQQKDKEEALKKTQDLDSKWKDIFKDLRSDGSCYAKKTKVLKHILTILHQGYFAFSYFSENFQKHMFSALGK